MEGHSSFYQAGRKIQKDVFPVSDTVGLEGKIQALPIGDCGTYDLLITSPHALHWATEDPWELRPLLYKTTLLPCQWMPTEIIWFKGSKRKCVMNRRPLKERGVYFHCWPPAQLCKLNKTCIKNKEKDLLGEEKFFSDSHENGSNSQCKNKYTKEDMHWHICCTGTIRQCRKQKTHKTKNKL